MIFTSFYFHPDFKKHHNLIGISASVPDFFKGERLEILAPSWDLLNAYHRDELTNEQYSEQYLISLLERGVDPETIFDDIPQGSILLCYEPPGQFCHRRVLANWIEDCTGMIIPEWNSNETLDVLEKLADSVTF